MKEVEHQKVKDKRKGAGVALCVMAKLNGQLRDRLTDR